VPAGDDRHECHHRPPSPPGEPGGEPTDAPLGEATQQLGEAGVGAGVEAGVGAGVEAGVGAGVEALAERARAVLERHWDPRHRYSAPNRRTYPWLWLWDSSFHAVIWAHLGDDRSVQELETALSLQQPDGLVPHMGYQAAPDAAVDLWGVPGRSTITQPPMFGHALAELHRLGADVDHLFEPVVAGLTYFFEHRLDGRGLVRIVHPWESGIDDHPRWAPWQPQPFDRWRWAETKSALATELRVADGAAYANPAFDVCSASFNALVAFNARQVATVVGDDHLAARARLLARTLDDLAWDEQAGTWVDLLADGGVSSSVRTADALLGALVTEDATRYRRAMTQLTSPHDLGLPAGPAFVHPDEPCFDPSGYWRGAAWPQIGYLAWLAARRSWGPTADAAAPDHTRSTAGSTVGTTAGSGRDATARSAADTVARMLVRGATASGWAEYWHPVTGAGFGARPQSWTGLAAIPDLADRSDGDRGMGGTKARR
jgi:hypothetical protein